jgi:hypothetical protein
MRMSQVPIHSEKVMKVFPTTGRVYRIRIEPVSAP